MKKITEKIEELIEVLKEESERTAVSFTLFVTNESYEVTFNHRKPGDLENGQISMKNLKGHWIVE